MGIELVRGDYRTVCYVEREAFAVANVVTKMPAGVVGKASFWDDLTTFDGRPWRRKVDCITAGFPCQPFSCAGKQKGIDDERWIWPDIARIIGEVEPLLVFLENVPGLVAAGLGHVLGSLAALGLDAEWDYFSAGQMGAGHKRERVFILAYDPNVRYEWPRETRRRRPGPANECGELANDPSMLGQPIERSEPNGVLSGMGDAESLRGREAECRQPEKERPFPPGPNQRDEWRRALDRTPALEPAVCGVADGAAHRVDRLRLCGNGVVPVVAAAAFAVLARRAGLEITDTE